MYSILLAILAPVTIFLIIGGILYLFNKSEFINEDNFETIGVITFGLTVVTIVVTLIMPYEYHIEKVTYSLETLEDGHSTSGRLFLGCGMINDELTYSFYYEDKGYYKLRQVSTYRTKVKYVRGKAKFITYRKVCSKTLYNDFLWGIADEGHENYVICVPRGTIKNNYYLDAK